MVFKKLALEFSVFGEEDLQDMEDILTASCSESQGPMGDMTLMEQGILSSEEHVKKQKTMRKKRREEHYVMRDLVLALSLCNNVTPVYPDSNNAHKKEF